MPGKQRPATGCASRAAGAERPGHASGAKRVGRPIAATCAAERFDGTRALLGHMVELYQEHPILRDLYARTRRLREEWDGNTLFYDF